MTSVEWEDSRTSIARRLLIFADTCISVKKSNLSTRYYSIPVQAFF